MADVTTTFAAKDESFATTVDKLNSRLEGFQKEVANFSSKVGNMASSFGGFATKIGAVAAAFFGAQSAIQTFTQAISIGGQLSELSARTGESAGNLAILQRAFTNAGSSAEAVGPMLNRLQRFMVEASTGGAQQTAVMNALGVSLDDLKGKPPTEQMALFASRISEISDPAQRSAAAMEVFGKSGGELLPLLQNMGVEIDNARAQLGGYPDAVDKAASALDGIGDAFDSISKKAMEFVTGALVDIAPQIEAVLNTLAKVDFASLGMKLSSVLAKTFDFFRGLWADPKQIFGLIGDYLNATFRMAGDSLISAFLTAANAFRNLFGELIERNIFGKASDVLINAFNVAVAHLASYLFAQLTKVVTYFGELWGKVSNMGAAELGKKLWDVVTAFGSDYLRALVDPIGFAAQKLTGALVDASKASASEYQFAYDAATGSWIQKTQAGLDAVTTGAADRFSESSADFKTTLVSAADAVVEKTQIVNSNLLGGAQAVEEVNKRLSDIAAKGAEYRTEIEQATPASEKIKNDAAAMAGEGRNFAAAIAAAKIDASATANVFTGLSDRMKEAVGSTNKALDKMREAFYFGERSTARTTEMRMLENKVYLAERAKDRAYERAARYEKAGYERAAMRERQRADASLTKKLEELGPRLKRASEDASKTLNEAGANTASKKMAEGGGTAGNKLIDAGNQVAKTLTDATTGNKDHSKSQSPEFAKIVGVVEACRVFLKSIDTKLPVNALSV